jgi:hypothetical protein
MIERLAECVVRPHPTWQAGAGQLDTGVPPSIVAQFLGHKVIDRPGVLAPEDAVPPEPYLAELASRNMEVTLTTSGPALAEGAGGSGGGAQRSPPMGQDDQSSQGATAGSRPNAGGACLEHAPGTQAGR